MRGIIIFFVLIAPHSVLTTEIEMVPARIIDSEGYSNVRTTKTSESEFSFRLWKDDLFYCEKSDSKILYVSFGDEAHVAKTG